MQKLYGLILSVLLGVPFVPAMAAEYLPKDVLKTVYASTYEVVVKKIGEGQIEYERELPLDQVPFHVRNDKYWSIGTAFAISEKDFVTAAHVFAINKPSQYNQFYLRDTKGKVYPVGKVKKYSGKQDFILFEMKSHKAKNFLTINNKLEVNEPIFSVGNALGEGVVVRDGLYTSNTPEQDAGEWNWIRFSAAASPGNSGGPLLDKKGQVVGIVLRKSQNENLNYALPISEMLNAPDNVATENALYRYGIDNMDFTKTERFKHKEKLPLSFLDLREKLVAAHYKFTQVLYAQMRKQYDKDIFPNGDGSRNLLHRTYSAEFPHLVWQKSDRTWSPYMPVDLKKSRLGANGYMQVGRLRSTLMMKIRKPDDISRSKFTHDAEEFMELVLKGLPFTRNLSGERIRITSLGKPRLDEMHVDQYKRKWFVRLWDLPYDDSSVVMVSLPTPNGNVSMLRRSGTSDIIGHLDDLKVLADFLYLSYYGSLSQWDEFLAQKKLLPEVFKGISMKYKPGKSLEFKSKTVAFSYDTELMDITDKSDIYLNLSYRKHVKDTRWEITRVAVGEEVNSGRYFDVTMNVKPNDLMDDSDKSNWKKLASREFPYNSESYFKNKTTNISTLYPEHQSKEENLKRQALFSVSYSIDGRVEQDAAKSKLDSFIQKLRIVEPE